MIVLGRFQWFGEVAVGVLTAQLLEKLRGVLEHLDGLTATMTAGFAARGIHRCESARIGDVDPCSGGHKMLHDVAPPPERGAEERGPARAARARSRRSRARMNVCARLEQHGYRLDRFLLDVRGEVMRGVGTVAPGGAVH